MYVTTFLKPPYQFIAHPSPCLCNTHWREPLTPPSCASLQRHFPLSSILWNPIPNPSQYSLYGHIKQLADAEKAGIEKAGGTADLYQLPETLSQDVLDKMHAPAKDASVPVLDDPATLKEYDGFLLGIPTRYGNFPAQWKV